MSGLIILFILGLWIVASYYLAKLILKPIKNSNIKMSINFALAILIFIAPVGDEIIGGFQFRQLCRDNVTLVFNENTARGKSVSRQKKEDKNYNNYLVPIVESQELYKDIGSDEIILGWNVFRAEGGILSRSLNLFESTKPYTFNGVCISPKWKKSIFSDFNITINYQ